MLSSQARRQSRAQTRAQSQVAFKLQFIGTVCESCARSFTYVPHMGIRHFTFVFKESPSETPSTLHPLPYPTLPCSTNDSCSQLSVELGLVSVFELVSVSYSVSVLFFLGFFFFSDSTAFVVDDDKDRNRMTRSCSPKQAPVTQFSGLFQASSSVDSLGQMKMKMKRFGA